MRATSHDAIMRTVGRAIDLGGKQKTAASFELDAAGRCQSPKVVTITGRPSGTLSLVPFQLAGERSRFRQNRDVVIASGLGPKARTLALGASKPTAVTLNLDVNVRCRKCDACLKARAYSWSTRAKHEIKTSQRTWFVTLTLRPDRAFYYLEKARSRVYLAGTDLDTCEPHEQFAEWCREIGKEVTLSYTRLRKNSRAKIRQLIVFERHKSGTPHIHSFIHETLGSVAVTKRMIQSEWHEGFSNVKLVDKATSHAAYYCTKYLTKDFAARIRASIQYGCIEIDGTPIPDPRPKAIANKVQRETYDTPK